jgi:vacuolar-type H+-ATPase subunit D/Vma8
MAALKTKKVRNQLRLVKDKSDETTSRLEEAYKELDRIRSELNDNSNDHKSRSLIMQTEDGRESTISKIEKM